MILATLRRDDAAPIILKALREGRLQRQIQPDATCLYRNGLGHPCAIGVLVDDETAKEMDDIGGTIRYLVNYGAIKVDDFLWFINVQHMHDRGYFSNLENYLESTIRNKQSGESLVAES